ncbi:MAG: hypothetical protein JWP08_2696 [Bryobacterales bacterium]|nr:hypothetical protein [Bryobacterales bacterium]
MFGYASVWLTMRTASRAAATFCSAAWTFPFLDVVTSGESWVAFRGHSLSYGGIFMYAICGESDNLPPIVQELIGVERCLPTFVLHAISLVEISTKIDPSCLAPIPRTKCHKFPFVVASSMSDRVSHDCSGDNHVYEFHLRLANRSDREIRKHSSLHKRPAKVTTILARHSHPRKALARDSRRQRAKCVRDFCLGHEGKEDPR